MIWPAYFAWLDQRAFIPSRSPKIIPKIFVIHLTHLMFISIFGFSNCIMYVNNHRTNAWYNLVSYPSRWSLSFIFGFLWWSSSWQWQPHIAGCKLCWPLLRTGLTVLVQFFCKMYFLYVSRSRKKNWATFYGFFPSNNGW